jgi:hypothetical protein
MNSISSVIYYDKEKQLYNFPFVIKYKNIENSIDFFFKQEEFKNQEDMVRERIFYCSKQLFTQFMTQFESLQEICLDETIEANDKSVQNINNILNILIFYFNLFESIHCHPNVTSRLYEIYDELLEMFLLLDDYYPNDKKNELFIWKNKFINLLS